MRGYRGTDLPEHTATIAPITCPFTGELLTAVPALELDVAIIHAQRADREGNVQMWGLTGVQKEAVLAAKRSLVTVEEIVDELDPRPNAVVLPNWVVSRVAEVPDGAHPSYAHDYYERDNAYYREWDAHQQGPRELRARGCGAREVMRVSELDDRRDDERRGRAGAAGRRRPASSASGCRARPRTSRAARTRPSSC